MQQVPVEHQDQETDRHSVHSSPTPPGHIAVPAESGHAKAKLLLMQDHHSLAANGLQNLLNWNADAPLVALAALNKRKSKPNNKHAHRCARMHTYRQTIFPG